MKFGLLLDIARQFHNARQIRAYIDRVASHGGTYLVLHFSDNENYAIESEILGQTPALYPIDESGSHLNTQTQRYFLSKAEIQELCQHAQSKGIALIPEVGAPAHVRGLIDLLGVTEPTTKTNIYGEWRRQMYFGSATNDFMKRLYDEVCESFTHLTYFHMGGDEFYFESDWKGDITSHFKTLSEHLQAKGLKVMCWNDVMIKGVLESLSTEIEVLYWAWDGQRQDPEEAANIRNQLASVPELVSAGFKVINTNGYYLYTVPRAGDITSHNCQFSGRDCYLNWDLKQWDGTNKDNRLEGLHGIIGSCMAIWGENTLNKIKPETIIQYVDFHMKAISDLTLKQDEYESLKAEAQAGFVNSHYDVFVDFSLADTGSSVEFNLAQNGHQRLKLLNTHLTDRTVTLTVKGSNHDKVVVDRSWWEGGNLSMEPFDGNDDIVIVLNKPPTGPEPLEEEPIDL